MSHRHRHHSGSGHIGAVLAKIALDIGAAIVKKKIADRNAGPAAPGPKPKEPGWGTGKVRKR